MGFLNSGLLWFAMGGLIPIIIHLLNRQKHRRVRWAAMEFLLAAIRRTQRRLRIENLILLLIRIAVMILLALAIARPFLQDSAATISTESNTLAVFVIDNSYSMGYKTAQKTSLEKAKEKAGELLKNMKIADEDRVAIVLMSDAPELLYPPNNKKNLAQETLENVILSDFGTSFPLTLDVIADALARSQNPTKKVFIFTDLQRQGWMADAAESQRANNLLKELCKQAEFHVVDVGDAKPENGGVVDLKLKGRTIVTRKSAAFTAEIFNHSPAELQGRVVNFFVNGEKRDTARVTVPGQGSTLVSFDHEFLDPGQYHVVVSLENDYLAVDDDRFLAVEVKPAIRVLCIDGQPSEGDALGETDFFLLALDPYREGLTFAIEKTIPSLFTGEDLEPYDLIVLANVQFLPADKIARIEEFVKAGGGLLVALGDLVDKTNYNDHFYRDGNGLLPGRLEAVGGDETQNNPLQFVEVQYDHPSVRYFREHDLKAALSSLIFFEFYKTTVRPNDEKSRVIARFNDDDASPAILEKTFGDGRVIVLTTTLDVHWNMMAGRPPFLVLMNELAFYLSSKPDWGKNLMVGDAIQITLPMSRHADRFNLAMPSKNGGGGAGGYVSLTPTLAKGENKFMLAYPAPRKVEPEEKKPEIIGEEKKIVSKARSKDGVREAGVYTLSKVDKTLGEQLVSFFAANVDPLEGNLERINSKELRLTYPDFEFKMIGGPEENASDVSVKTPPSNIWRTILFAILGLLLAESALAWFFGRHKT